MFELNSKLKHVFKKEQKEGKINRRKPPSAP
jgi:hypothetical protein